MRNDSKKNDKDFIAARDFYQTPPISSSSALCKSTMSSQSVLNASTNQRCRSRSNTAPPKPSPEGEIQPCELPGSLPMRNPASNPNDEIVTTYVTHANLGSTIERPHSSPELGSMPFSAPLARSYNENSFNRVLQQSDFTSNQYSGPGSATVFPHGSTTPISFVSQSSTPQPMQTAVHVNSLPIERPFHTPLYSETEVSRKDTQAGDLEAVLMQQISAMRVSHDAHLTSLKTAHEQELSSHRSYIAFLEKRQQSACPESPPTSQSQDLKLDTKRASIMPSELTGLDVSPTLSQASQSGQSSRKQSEQEVIEAAAEATNLRRQLSLVLKEQSDNTDICRERDQLKDTLETKDRKIAQLRDIVARAKENEKTLRNSITKLEASLETANNERIDALECFHHVNNDLVKVRNEHSKLKQQLPAARAVHFEDGTPTATISELKAKLKKKEIVIANFERQQHQIEQQRRQKAGIDEHNEARLRELQSNAEQSHQFRIKAEVERDQYNSLLHIELRKQADQAARNAKILTPALAEKATKQLQTLIHHNDQSDENSIARLEKQLEQCLKDIIVYKLDMRSYQRDIKKLNNELNAFRAPLSQRPPTPESDISRKGSSDSNVSVEDSLGIKGFARKQSMTTTNMNTKQSIFTSPALIELSPPMQKVKPVLVEMSSQQKPRPAALDLSAQKTTAMASFKDKTVLKPLASFTTPSPQPHLKSPPPQAKTSSQFSSSQVQSSMKSPPPQMQIHIKASPDMRKNQSSQPSTPPMVMKVKRVETDRSLPGSIISSYARTPPQRFTETTS
ncbi:hypothetical protein MRB53_038576 [Persea americana]|nr:hypothetical protein MRB53_038576 [Persea americana]